MIIDMHTHLAYNRIFPRNFLSGVAGSLAPEDPGSAAFLEKLANSQLRDADGSVGIRQMDAAGIDKAVLLIADFGYALGEAELSIGQIHALHAGVLQAHPDRFIVFGGVDPRRGKAGVDIFEKSLREYNFKGLKLYPPCGFELDHPGLFPLYELCVSHNLPVLTHTGPSLPTMRTEVAYPNTLLSVTAAFPGLRFVLAHGGAVNWQLSVELALARKNVFFDISTFQARISDQADLKHRLRYFFDHSPDQVLFGSDWPMFLLSASPGKLVEMIENAGVLSTAELEKLFWHNATRVLLGS